MTGNACLGNFETDIIISRLINIYETEILS